MAARLAKSFQADLALASRVTHENWKNRGLKAKLLELLVIPPQVTALIEASPSPIPLSVRTMSLGGEKGTSRMAVHPSEPLSHDDNIRAVIELERAALASRSRTELGQ